MAADKRECAECGKALNGRADKRFCDDSCRNAFNYSRNRPASNYMRKVAGILKRNRQILESLNPEGKKKLHRDKLSEQGFNFTYHTHTINTRKGTVYQFCFEQGYAELGKDWLLLVRRDEYLEKN